MIRTLFALFTFSAVGLANGVLVAGPANALNLRNVARVGLLGGAILKDGFEGSGSETVWTTNLAPSSVADFDHTGDGVTEGTNALRLVRNGNTCQIYQSFADGDKVWFRGSLRIASVSTNNTIMLLTGTDGTDEQGSLSLRSTGALRIYGNGGGTVYATTSGTMSAGTNYYFWAYWNLATGAFNVEWQTTNSRTGSGGNYAQGTGGDTGTADTLVLQLSNDNTLYCDQLQLHTSALW